MTDVQRILGAQALRAFLYGLCAVLLGTTLRALDFSPLEAGLVLAMVVAGTVIASVAVARYGDRWGRRRWYGALFLALIPVGTVFAFASQAWVLAPVALLGVLSTEVVESGPFTSLEQAMLASELDGNRLVRTLGIYNAVATGAGALGALAAAAPALLRDVWSGAPPDQRWFLLLIPSALVGAALARSLSSDVEPGRSAPSARLVRSRPVIGRLSALFALDAFGGAFVIPSFLAYWFAERYGATPATIGAVFAAAGVLQTASFVAAPRLAERFGLLPTMVFTHLPSNVLLVLVAFAPSLAWAIAALLARTCLSQMDVPTRQAYVIELVDPDERTAAVAYTNTARYAVRPTGPLLAGAASSIALGLPIVIAGSVKAAYDLTLWRWFRPRHTPAPPVEERTS
ncbi:MAG: MFS transporter [Acidimicrobiia bacterium]